MRKHGKFAALILIAAMLLNLAACASTAKETETKTETKTETETKAETEAESKSDAAAQTETLDLVLMTYDSTMDGFDDWIARVEAACNLNITVIPTSTNSYDRQAEITTVLSTGDEGVDVITINDEMYVAFKNTGWMEDLSKDIMTPEVVATFPEKYMEELVQAEDGSIYSVPMHFSGMGLLVNKKKMAELGFTKFDTWDEYLEFIKTATTDDCFGFGGAWEASYAYSDIATFVDMFGGDYFDWNNEKTRAGFHALYSLLQDGYTDKNQTADKFSQMYQKLVDGTIASCFVYQAYYGSFSAEDARAFYEGDDSFITVVLPPVCDEETGRVGLCNCWHYVMNAASPHKEAARRFLEYSATYDAQLDYATTFGRFPAVLEAINDPAMDDVIAIEQMRDTVANVDMLARPMVAESMDHITAMGNLLQSLVLGEIDEEGFYKEAQEIADNYR